ncbi:MAG: bifunctional folylpolyglutamate synthase/dihydrofolate synthase, partial [Muribaculaceae bacterium]|nr:bifunctional folylpolyglutamate synthase/dihydrofolate synthase [Muribaculaceae bacterium]
LGGRLDSTNTITPDLCVITNISKDHTQFLGNTIAEIAGEKAGIIKAGIPVVIGESDEKYNRVFEQKAHDEGAPIVFADAEQRSIGCQLKGIYQQKNINTALCAIEQLRCLGYDISDEQIADGFAHVCDLTGFMGRWMQVGENPKVVCDAGHNVGGIRYVVEQLGNERYKRLHMVVGFVSDKDIENILGMLPRNAVYYFAKASIPRALDADKLQEMAKAHGLEGDSYGTVSDAYEAALADAGEDDMVYVGGSCFVVADLLKYLQNN